MAQVFISYSHKDEALRGELDKHLALLKREGAIDLWSDHRILPGSNLDSAISAALEAAQIILLLVSSDFLASDYCYGVEMRRALERNDEGSAVLVPVILRPCDWTSSPFRTLRALPQDGRPIVKWSSHDDAFLDVVQGLRRLLAAHASMPDRSSAGSMRISAARPVQSARIAVGRSGNLALPQRFTDQDRHEFAEDTFEYIKDYFRRSLDELQQRNPGYSGKLRNKNAQGFAAVIFDQGKRVASCYVRLGAMMSQNDIAYSNSDAGSDNSYNDILHLHAEAHGLQWRAMIGGFHGGNPSTNLSQEGAAEHLWSAFIGPLQRR